TRRPLVAERLGGARENVGVTLFAARPSDDGGREVWVGVAAAGDHARRARVTLQGGERSAAAWSSGAERFSRVLAQREVEIPAGEEVELRFPLRAGVAALRVSVAPVDGRGDDLPTDDVFTMTLPERGGRPPVRWLASERLVATSTDTSGGSGADTGASAASAETLRFFAEEALRAAGVEELGPLVPPRRVAPEGAEQAGADAQLAPAAVAQAAVGAPAEEPPALDLPEGAIVVSLGAPTRRVSAPLLILGGGPPPKPPAAQPPIGHGYGHPYHRYYGAFVAPASTVTTHWPLGVRALGVLEGESTSLRRVDPRHPITRDVWFDGVTIVRAHAIDPGAGVPLVELDGRAPSDPAAATDGIGGTVVAAGGEGIGRWVYVGLDPSGSDVVLRVAYPMLVAAALDWLAGEAEVHAATTPRVEEVALRAEADELETFGASSLPRPPLPWLLAALAALLLALEGFAYARRVVD
ncbi:MAG: hypothetical protein KF901_20750, partial [Myxococcales bacterium]|nr:hypothetical protein [Myxococcales bacterium]